ncbi:MAG: NHLP family bacteriocin export ABC transporter peptidase/permease/ATPase subunit [Oscillospiraceae bacterium]|nr:NHLP family bacteriocin export ABC transporter peptidase/permease/ATPase subunit [Oscillospiraceae bacterium]
MSKIIEKAEKPEKAEKLTKFENTEKSKNPKKVLPKKILKVPFIMQMEALECGAASLCMVLAYYKKWIPLEQVRADCGVSRDGCNARNIYRAAVSYGMKPTAYRMEPSELRNLKLPAIIHWNFNHFVVLNGFKKKCAVINDPGRGTTEVSLEEFDKSFTGIVMTFEPTEEFVPEGKPRSVMGFAMKRMKGTLTAFAFVFLMGVFASLIDILNPVFTRIFMDDILSGTNRSWLIPFVMAMLIALVVRLVLSVINAIYRLRMEGKFAVTANAEFLWHVLRLPMEFFSQRYAGDILMRQASNEGIASMLISQLSPIIINMGLMVFYFIMLLQYNPILTAIGISSAVLNMVLSQYMAKKSVAFARLSQASGGNLGSITMSSIDMIETIKASGAEGGIFERYSGYLAKQHNAAMAGQRFQMKFGLVPQVIGQILNIVVMMIGVMFIMDGYMTIGTMAAFQGFLGSFLAPVGQLSGVAQSFTMMRTNMERIEDVINYKTEPQFAEGTAGKLSGSLKIDNITFGYNKLSPPLIKNFSLELKPGKSVAIVGASGSGKSTLAKLVTGLYEPWEGEITFGGKKRTEIDEYSFRSSVSMVDQEVTLFEDTVAENIRMWDPSIEDYAVILAARDADIHETIVTRQGGYNQVVAENGKNFSGGQRQRLEIARVLAQEPVIAVLDEATSALDAKTEETVMNNIRELGCSCIVIAHRLSTVRDCDEIIVLEKGDVVERGTHEELFAKGGKYTELVATE